MYFYHIRKRLYLFCIVFFLGILCKGTSKEHLSKSASLSSTLAKNVGKLDMDSWIQHFCNEDVAAVDHAAQFLFSHRPDDSSDVMIVGYVDDNIESYAKYSNAINFLYSRIHQYSYWILTPSDLNYYYGQQTLDSIQEIVCVSASETENNCGEDVRWIKVWVMLNLLQDKRFVNVKYFMWMDSDLIVLDLLHNFFDIITSNKWEYDLILSSEHHAETGVANTGLFIVKNSDFSRRFFQIWYNGIDHAVGHDQIGFDYLYKNFNRLWQINVLNQTPSQNHVAIPSVTKHIKILPTNAMNSIPPAYLHHHSQDKVLHLMGEDAGYRSKVFHFAVHCICELSIDGYSITYSKQNSRELGYFDEDLSFCSNDVESLGLSLPILASILVGHTEVVIYRDLLPRIQSIFRKLNEQDHDSDDSKAIIDVMMRELLGKLAVLRELLLQQGKVVHSKLFDSTHNTDESFSVSITQLLSRRVNILHEVTAALSNFTRLNIHSGYEVLLPLSPQIKLELYNIAAMLLNDLLQEMELSISYCKEVELGECIQNFVIKESPTQEFFLNTYDTIQRYLIKVLNLVGPEQEYLVLEMLGMHYMNYGIYVSHVVNNSTSKEHMDAMYTESFDLFQLSMETYMRISPDKINKFQVARVHQHFAQYLCDHINLTVSRSYEKLMEFHFNKAINSMINLLSSEQQVKEDHYRVTSLISIAIDCQCRKNIHYSNINCSSEEVVVNWMNIWQNIKMRFYGDHVFQEYFQEHPGGQKSPTKKLFRRKKKS